MKQFLLITIVTIMLLGACSSNTPKKTQYYLLNSPTNINATAINNENTQNIAIKLLELPDYLKQPSLVLQLSSHQLHYSHFHMWAEPLQSSFSQALSQDLNHLDSRYHFIVSPSTHQETANRTVIVNVTAFHATHQSQAILTGTYWLESNGMQSQAKAYNFNLTVTLNQNGYEHAVEQMRKSVSQLAQTIANTLKAQ